MKPDETTILGKSAEEFAAVLNLQDAPPEVKVELLELYGKNVMDRLFLELVSRLPDKVNKQLEERLGTMSLKEMYDLVSPHVPGFSEMVREVVEKEFPKKI
jgi:hypothetical protein